MATKTDIQTPGFAEKWQRRVRAAWQVPEILRPSQTAERYRVLHNSSVPGPYRLSNAPYQRGMMDIPTRPGCVRFACQKGARIGWSEVLKNIILDCALMNPFRRRVGLVLPSRDEGRKMVRSDILPMFYDTPALRELVGSMGRDVLRETIDLINGFHLGLMWPGSAASTAGKLYAVGIIDELDKTEDWGGVEPDLIGRIESRISTYRDWRLLLAGSTPTTTAGKIHQMMADSSFVIHYTIHCPACGHRQRLIWDGFKWAKIPDLDRWLPAAKEAAANGVLHYEDRGHVERFNDSDALVRWIELMETTRRRMTEAASKGPFADALTAGRDRMIWYQCQNDKCPRRIFDAEKAAVIRNGIWTTERGMVTDYWGNEHEDAEAVERWPNETRIGCQLPTWYSLFMHWQTIVAEFLRAEGDLGRAYNWRTERAGEPFEFRIKRMASGLFAGKVTRATLAAGVVPAWGQLLLCTIDTQVDHFYVVVRAWGAGERSQRVWHGKLMTFDQIDHLLFEQTWPVDPPEAKLPPRRIDQAIIDSGGTEDRWLDATRTQQVYTYVIPRQAVIRAIKGASRPGPSLYWRMKSPMGGSTGGKTSFADLRAWMVDKHRCNDLLADMIVAGIPREGPAEADPLGAGGLEKWLLNSCPGPELADSWDEYNRHLSAVHKAPDKPGRHMVEVWKPVHSGARIDYRDCYDAETEVLTRRGWLRFSSLSEGDWLATVNLSTDRIEYQQPSAIIDKPYDGEMIQIGGQRGSRVDLLVTPGHRMVIRPSKRRPDRRAEIRQAEDLFKTNLLKMTATWSVASPVVDAPQVPGASLGDLAEFFGWYVSEGYCRQHVHASQPSSVKRKVILYQQKVLGRDQIRTLVARLPWRFCETDRGFVCSDRRAFDLVCSMGNQHTRRVPDWIRHGPRQVIDAFLRGAIGGDGWNDRGTECYGTCNADLAGDIQELFLKTGSASSMSVRPAQEYAICGRRGWAGPVYTLKRRRRHWAGLTRHDGTPTFRRVAYRGRVYCATVPNGTLIVRRNGQTAICGNCEAYMVALAQMCYVHLLPPEEEYLISLTETPSAGTDEPQYVERFRRRE